MSELEFGGFMIRNMLSSKTGPELELEEHAEGHSLRNKGLSWQGGTGEKIGRGSHTLWVKPTARRSCRGESKRPTT